MAYAVTTGTNTRTTRTVSATSSSPAYVAYQILHIGFAVLPILAGADKFLHILTDWDKYLAPSIASTVSVDIHTFMMAVGAIEIVAGIIVLLRPRIGAYIVTVWLWGIIINLFMLHGFFDVALRDFGLSLGALALAKLSQEFNV